MSTSGFPNWPKIPRLEKDMVITEKIDGTNGVIHICSTYNYPEDVTPVVTLGDTAIFVGSRHRWIYPENDNFGFAAWVKDNAEELIKLGDGSHHGEWWGLGIQRGYYQSRRKFSLFNTFRWNKYSAPACCEVVPILYKGPFKLVEVERQLQLLRINGSSAAPGFPSPEGLIVQFSSNDCRQLYKVHAE